MKWELGEPQGVALSVLIPINHLGGEIMETSPIREQTAFMETLTALRTKYEADMAALYASQREYKEAYSLVETVKSFGFGDLDQLQMSVAQNDGGMLFAVECCVPVETLFKALDITGVSYASRLSASSRRLHIAVHGSPRLVFSLPAESITLEAA